MKFALRLGLSIALIALLFTYVVDARQFADVLRDFHPGWLVVALAAITADRVLMAYKWTVLLQAQGHRVPLLQAVTIYCTSMVWGLALPATVGADAVRAMLVTKRGVSGTDAVTSIVIERMVGFVLALALGIVSLMVLRALGVLGDAYDAALYAAMLVLAGTIGLLLASMNKALVRNVVARLPERLRRSRLMHYASRFTAAYHSLGAERAAIARFAALTAIEQLFFVLLPWTLAKGLGVPVDLLLLLGVLPVTLLISRLPISFDGLGVFEAVFIGLLMLAGISPEASLAIAISGRIIQIVAFLPWWAVHVLSSGDGRAPAEGTDLFFARRPLFLKGRPAKNKSVPANKSVPSEE